MREQDLPSGKWVQNQKSWRKEDHVEDDERIHTVDEFQDCRRDQGVSVRNQDDMSEEAAVSHEDESHIENKASVKRPPKRVESGVYVIDVCIKDLIGTKVSFFLKAVQAAETSVPVRPATDVDEHQFGHGQRDSEVQGVSGKEERKQREEEEKEGSQGSKGPRSTVNSGGSQTRRVSLAVPNLQHKAAANTERTTRVLSADHCFAGAENTSNESQVLAMIDSETSVVFAHVCRKEGFDADALEAMMGDIEVPGYK